MTDSPGPSPRSRPAGSLSGQVLDGRYRVERLLGQGGMSEVYLGHHLALDRPCAIKVVSPTRATDPEAHTRFEREATAASRIAHPNVCRIYDFGSTPDGLRYLVLEYLDGQPLSARLEAGPLALSPALDIARQCAAGLAAAHEAGIVHRDLKADNVMLTRRDGSESAVLVDFGIARPVASGELTREGLMVGTPDVMSPEQIAGDPVGPASDQYQLGLLLVRMLTGRLPFPGETTQERMTSRLTIPPAALAELAPGLRVTAELQRAIDTALARRPADRFASVKEFAAALGGTIRPGLEPATEILARPLPPRERPRMRAVTWAGITALAIAGSAAGWLLLQPDEPVAPPPAVAAPAADSSSDPRSVPGAVPPALPPAVQPGTEVLPSLPSEELVFSDDPAERLGAREAAERVYRSGRVADTLRAAAAYLIAETHRSDGAPDTARVWLQRCLDLQERAICRRLLSILP